MTSSSTNALIGTAARYAANYAAQNYLGTTAGAAASGASGAGASSSAGTPYLSIAQTALNVGEIIGSNATEEDKVQSTKEQVGLAVANYYTAGLASLAYNFAWEHWPGFMSKLRAFDQKFDLVGRAITSLFDTDKWKTEGKRMKALVDQGVEIPEALRGSMELTRGRSKEELIDHSVPRDFVGFKPDGMWVNNKFADSRDEKDLHPQDIWGYSCFFEKFGNDWLGKLSVEQRCDIAQKALDLGCVREHIGTIDVKWTPELTQYADSVLGS